jgi:hypothetical protein
LERGEEASSEGVFAVELISSGESLQPSECWELLRTASLGRLVLSVRALPALLPVQYYVDGDELAICLGHHAVPEVSINDVVVAFGADAIEPESRSGWTVQVLGTTRLPKAIGVPTHCGQPTAGPMVHLTPSDIRGERVQLCPFLSAITGVDGER